MSTAIKQKISPADYPKAAYPETYADPDYLDQLFADMRAKAPVVWQQPEGYRPFWSISKYKDIQEISRQPDKFTNDPRSVLQDIEAEEWIAQMTGGQRLLRTLIDMDPPDHKLFRDMTVDWFQPGSLKSVQPQVDAIARTFVDRMAAAGPECDFVNEIAIWYPLRVIMMILGVPEEDEAFLLKLTQELFGARDPDMQRKETSADNMNVIADFYAYFEKITEDRRKNPKDDVASVIANATINGKPIGHLEAMSYYIIVATAGHDTTSSSSSGGLLELVKNQDQLKKLQGDMSLLNSAVDEMIRWTTPVKHFMRTAQCDYELRGQTIRKDQAVMMHYISGNRDDEAFDDPYTFKVDRSPNRHIAFGYGPHLCLGQYLAKMEMRSLFAQMLPRLKAIELNGDPAHVQSAFVSGLKRLPIRFQMA